MDKQEAIKRLKRLMRSTGNPSDIGCMNRQAVKLAIDTLENDGWISVDDKSPEIVNVLVSYKYGVMEGRKHEKGYYTKDLSCQIPGVTHWQPLPQHPKEKHNG